MINCTGWSIYVGLYLVWYAFDTGFLWHISPQLRGAIQAFPAAAIRVLLGPLAHEDLVRYLSIIDETRWDDVYLGQSERPGPAGFWSDRSQTEKQMGGAYLYIDPVTGFLVNPWAGKRRRCSMYDGDSPHAKFQAHFAFASGPPRTFADVSSNLGAMLPAVQEHNP